MFQFQNIKYRGKRFIYHFIILTNMPTIGYAAAEIYYNRLIKNLSDAADKELETIIGDFESRPKYRRILHSAFSTKDYLKYSAAKHVRNEYQKAQ